MQPFDSARERIATLQQFNSFRVVAAGHGGVEGTAALADQTMPKFGDDPRFAAAVEHYSHRPGVWNSLVGRAALHYCNTTAAGRKSVARNTQGRIAL